MGVAYLGPDWLRDLINDDKCFWDPIGVTLGPHARQAGQEEPTLDDALLARLSPVLEQFHHLEALDISRSAITDRSAKLLATFDTLTRLRLSQNQVSDETIRHISRLRQLKSLDLYNTAITDECVSDLCQLGNLAYLDIRRTGITSVGLSRLHADLPHCKIVN